MPGNICAEKSTTLNEYQNEAAAINRPMDLLHSSLALAEEAGEVVAVIRRAMYRDLAGTETMDHLQDELGDVLWCVAACAADVGLDLEQIARRNLAKLHQRHDLPNT